MSQASISSGFGFFNEAKIYVANIKNFKSDDWIRYLCWIGTISGLFLATSSFILFGVYHGVKWPGYVWNIPVGTGMFTLALAIDDIGHRTLYKKDLLKGEAYVHQMIMITAVTSVMALCLCYDHGETFRMPALSLIVLSFFYSVIDEALHWHRYLTKRVDRVEMWAHFVAIGGHVIMITSWWYWYDAGYQGVKETVAFLPW